MLKAFLILIALLTALSPCSALEKLHVSGRRILTERGREVRLRGVNFGWWVTPVDESDFARAKALGCNYIRLAFTYNEIEESPGIITDKSLKWLDDRINWAEKQGLWVIPEMHIVPGGQMWSDWCEGGKNLMWTTPEDQDRLIAQWKAVARHFSGRAVIAAYEPMNEPALPNGVTEEDYRKLNERIIKAIRQVDRITPIAIDCTDTGGPTGMAKLLPLDDPQIIYSFHFYFPYEVTHQGQAYPQKDFKGRKLDKALLEEQMRPAIEFEKKVAAPICVRGVRNRLSAERLHPLAGGRRFNRREAQLALGRLEFQGRHRPREHGSVRPRPERLRLCPPAGAGGFPKTACGPVIRDT